METIFLLMTCSLLAVFTMDTLQKRRKFLSEGK
jgi:hypothetical protein